MIWFYLSAAVLVAISLLILAPTLFNRRQLSEIDLEEQNLQITRQRLAELGESESDEDAKLELEAALIDDLKGPEYDLQQRKPTSRAGAVGLMVVIPIAAGLIYSQLGDFSWQRQLSLPTAAEIAEDPAASMTRLLGRLEELLEQNPEDAAGWELAARTYMTVGQYDQAERAYARLHRLSGDHPDTFTGWADASLMANGSVYTEEISARISRALEMDPNHVSALWIAAMGARSVGRVEVARSYLERLLPLVAQAPEALAETRAAIESLSATAGDNSANEATETQVTATDGNDRRIVATVRLDPSIQAKTTPQDTVFVFARAVNGPPAPLAAVKLRVADLPTAVILDRSSAMIEGMDITTVGDLTVTARVAKGGGPIAQPGDLTSEPIAVSKPGTAEIALNISRQITAN